MLGGADNPNGELLSYIIGADSELCQQWTEQPNEHRTMMFGLSFYSQ